MRWKNRLKLMISGGLTVFAVILALLAGRPAGWLAALAMGISAFADALLAGYPDCLAGVKDRLVKGGLIFLAAHLLYILALVVSYGKGVPALLPAFALPFAVFLGLTLLHGALFYFRARSSEPRAFFAAASVYLLTVGVHAAAAVTVSGLSGGLYALSVAGALLFYLSDAILLAGKYGALRGKCIPVLIWVTYVPAQFCLLLGLYLAQRALP